MKTEKKFAMQHDVKDRNPIISLTEMHRLKTCLWTVQD